MDHLILKFQIHQVKKCLFLTLASREEDIQLILKLKLVKVRREVLFTNQQYLLRYNSRHAKVRLLILVLQTLYRHRLQKQVHPSRGIHRNTDPNAYNQILQGGAQSGNQSINIPQGFHYSTDYNTLNMIPNLGNQGTQNYNPQAVPHPRNQTHDLLRRMTEMMQHQFGLKPRGQTVSYRHPYPEWYDLVALPHNYRILEFTCLLGKIAQAPQNMSVDILLSWEKLLLRMRTGFDFCLYHCQDQHSLSFQLCRPTLSPTRQTWRRNFIPISMLGQVRKTLQIWLI